MMMMRLVTTMMVKRMGMMMMLVTIVLFLSQFRFIGRRRANSALKLLRSIKVFSPLSIGFTIAGQLAWKVHHWPAWKFHHWPGPSLEKRSSSWPPCRSYESLSSSPWSASSSSSSSSWWWSLAFWGWGWVWQEAASYHHLAASLFTPTLLCV